MEKSMNTTTTIVCHELVAWTFGNFIREPTSCYLNLWCKSSPIATTLEKVGDDMGVAGFVVVGGCHLPLSGRNIS